MEGSIHHHNWAATTALSCLSCHVETGPSLLPLSSFTNHRLLVDNLTIRPPPLSLQLAQATVRKGRRTTVYPL